MSEYYCPNCGAPVEEDMHFCKNCGINIDGLFEQDRWERASQEQAFAGYQADPRRLAIDPNWPVKSKIAAGVLGILLGDLGIHKFYLGKIGMGILYLVFCWTGIPGIIGLVEGIIYLCTDDVTFQLKHQVRLE